MKATTSLILAVLFTSLFAQAETYTPPLYQIEKNGNLAFLLGTVEGVGGKAEDISFAALKVITATDTLIVDGSVVEITREEFLSIVPDGAENSLRDQMTDEEWYKLLYYILPESLQESAALLPTVGSLNPSVAVVTYLSQASVKSESPLDQAVPAVFSASKKTVLALEDSKTYFTMRASYQDAEELKRLLAIPTEELEATAAKMAKAFLTNDIATLATLTASQYTPEDFKTVVTDRVALWAPQVEQIIAGNAGTELFMLNVETIVGEKGMVSLLKKAGFTVTLVDQSVPRPVAPTPGPAPVTSPALN